MDGEWNERAPEEIMHRTRYSKARDLESIKGAAKCTPAKNAGRFVSFLTIETRLSDGPRVIMVGRYIKHVDQIYKVNPSEFCTFLGA